MDSRGGYDGAVGWIAQSGSESGYFCGNVVRERQDLNHRTGFQLTEDRLRIGPKAIAAGIQHRDF